MHLHTLPLRLEACKMIKQPCIIMGLKLHVVRLDLMRKLSEATIELDARCSRLKQDIWSVSLELTIDLL